MLRFLGCIFAFLPVSAMAAHICWIDKVDSISNGVELHFSKNAPGNCFRINNKEKSADCPYTKAGETAHMKLDLGDQVYISQTPHDVCTLEVKKQHDHIGVKAKASFYMHGIGANSSEQFIKAE